MVAPSVFAYLFLPRGRRRATGAPSASGCGPWKAQGCDGGVQNCSSTNALEYQAKFFGDLSSNRDGVNPGTEHYKGERRAGDECSRTPFFRLPLVHYLAL